MQIIFDTHKMQPRHATHTSYPDSSTSHTSHHDTCNDGVLTGVSVTMLDALATFFQHVSAVRKHGTFAVTRA